VFIKKSILVLLSLLSIQITKADFQNLKIGIKTDISSVDPHYQVWGPNFVLSKHLFDALVLQDEYQNIKPGLAESWKQLSPTLYELTIRQNVYHHDGSLLNAEDVVYSLNRAREGSSSLSGLKVYTKHLTNIKIISPYKIQIGTAFPYALLLSDLATVAIMKKQDPSPSFQNMNEGKGVIGTGPFQFQKWKPGQTIELKRFDSYWRGKSPFQTLKFYILSNDISRLNALLAGDIDLIETVPLSEVSRITKNPHFRLFYGIPSRLIYLVPDVRKASTQAFDNQGHKLAINPLSHPLVRKAISYAIDRKRLAETLMLGFAKEAGQIVPTGSLGYNAFIKVDPYDPDLAKSFLKEAGFPEGFRLNIHGPQGRFLLDAKILEAIAPMLNRIGIITNVHVMPPAIFINQARQNLFTLSLNGWPINKEVITPLKAILHTALPEQGFGNFNRGNYSSPALDDIIQKALKELNGLKRGQLLEQASQIVHDDYALIPLIYQYNTWAAKKGLRYKVRMDEFTLAESIEIE
jgi:peptide/nickel transport system substrate-binding protein